MIVLAWILVLRAPARRPSDRYDRFKAFYNRACWRPESVPGGRDGNG